MAQFQIWSNDWKVWSRKGRKPFLFQYRSANWFIIFSVSTAVFTEIFLYGIIVPVMPFALQNRVGIRTNETQYWVSVLLAVYAAFLLAFSPICGWIADKASTRRLPLLVSLLTFAGATILLMFGRSIGVLIAGRALQGISAAAVWSIGLALLVDTIGANEIGEAMGYVSLSMSLAVFCAPLLGGIVYERSGYYAVFYMAYGVIALDILLRLLIIEKRVAQQWVANNDNDGSAVEETLSSRDENESVSTERKILPDEAKERQEMSEMDHSLPSERRNDENDQDSAKRKDQGNVMRVGKSTPTHSTGGVQASSWLPCTIKFRSPALLKLLASRRLLASLWASMALAIIMTSFDSVIPLRVAETFHWDSTGAGLIFLALVVPSLLNPLVGKVADRYGSRLFTAVGFLLNVPLLVCLRFVNHDSVEQKVILCALLTLIGFALSSTLIPILAEITYVVDAEMEKSDHLCGNGGIYAQGYGLMNAAYAAGTLVGPLWSGLVNDRAGWVTMSWSLSILSGVSAVLAFLFIGGWIGKPGVRVIHNTRKHSSESPGSRELTQEV